MNWFIGLVHDGHGADALTRSVQALRDAGWSDPISVFSEPMRNAPRLAGVEYRFARNRLGAYANWRRALREAAKRVADRYLLVLTSAELDPSVRTVLEQTDGEADAYFPYTSEANYTAVFTWSERPHGMWFDRVGANPSGAHTLCISSLARVKKLDELLPANSWAGKTAEDLLLEHCGITTQACVGGPVARRTVTSLRLCLWLPVAGGAKYSLATRYGWALSYRCCWWAGPRPGC